MQAHHCLHKEYYVIPLPQGDPSVYIAYGQQVTMKLDELLTEKGITPIYWYSVKLSERREPYRVVYIAHRAKQGEIVPHNSKLYSVRTDNRPKLVVCSHIDEITEKTIEEVRKALGLP